MNQYAVVQLISLLGFLILALSALNARRIGIKKGAAMALAWAAIFTLVTFFIITVGR